MASGHRLKGNKIIINAEETCIVPKPLPPNPDNGCITVDQTDNKLKCWDGSTWIILGNASDVVFDNSAAQLPNNPTNVQDAIEDIKNFRFQYLQFQYIGQRNFDTYLFSGADLGSINRESGNASNGYQFSNSAPQLVAFTGDIQRATAAVRGVAVSVGSPAASVELKFELWKVGFSGEGTKLGDITFDIDSSQYTIGTFWNSSVQTEFGEEQSQNVSVTAGDLLGLKFIRQQSSSTVVEFRNATIVLEITGNS